MQAAAATMTPELVMAAETPTVDTRAWSRLDGRRVARLAFLVVGLAATAFILGQYDSLLVYGLPAPFLRRVPVTAAA
jgi:hypothetical protein